MAHAPADEAPIPDGYSVSDEFFVYKFSKEQAGLSGLAFDEGIFGVFGYVTEASSEPSASCGFPQSSQAVRLDVGCPPMTLSVPGPSAATFWLPGGSVRWARHKCSTSWLCTLCLCCMLKGLGGADCWPFAGPGAGTAAAE